MAGFLGPFCTMAAAEVGEPLAGTAAEACIWVVYEFDGAWSPKPLESPGLAPGVREQLLRWQKSVPGCRVQLVRRGSDRFADEPTGFFVARSDASTPYLLRFSLRSPEDLSRFDLSAILEEGGHPEATRETEALHLVCTHGRRDPCCAKWGVPLFRALEKVEPSRVFQTTHVGGHRFAPSVVSLPHGYTYGRVSPEEAGALVEAHRRGLVHDPARLRGRSIYDAATQFAECTVRLATNARALDAFQPIERVTDERGQTHVRYLHQGVEGSLAIEKVTISAMRPASCCEPAEPVTILRAR